MFKLEIKSRGCSNGFGKIVMKNHSPLHMQNAC